MAQMDLSSHVQALNSWVPRISSISNNLALTRVGPTVELDANIYIYNLKIWGFWVNWVLNSLD